VPKSTEPTEMPFAADSCGPKETCIRFGQDQTNPFAAAKSGKSAMRPLVTVLRTLVFIKAALLDA